MGRTIAATPRHTTTAFFSLVFALALGVLIVLPSFAAAAPITIDVTNDANQSPVFTTFSDPLLADPGAWNEFQFMSRAYPLLGGHTSNKALPAVHVFATVPNGRYRVFANLYGQPANSYRYYYSYSSSNPSQYTVDVGPQPDCAEIQLNPINVTNGQFDIYFQKADATAGPENYFGWAWVTLVPVNVDVTRTPASSTWSLLLLGGVGAVVAAWGLRHRAA